MQGKRKIDISKINLSSDVRITDAAYNSESKALQPALIVVARDNSGKLEAIQTIYLDEKTGDKDKTLEINKRSIGSLKGNFVELTRNKNSNTILVAEGLETGLSIANTRPDARVITDLGISNLANLSKYLSESDSLDNIYFALFLLGRPTTSFFLD